MFAKLENLELKFEDLEQQLSSAEVFNDQDRYRKLTKAHADLKQVVDAFRRYKEMKQNLADNKELLGDSDHEIRAMAHEEIKAIEAALPDIEQELKILLLPRDPMDDKNILLEIRAGTGGEEASLFAADLFRMYTRYAEIMGWKVEVMSASDSDTGGYKEIIALIAGDKVYSRLKYESGTHRVQRVPATEAQGRIVITLFSSHIQRIQEVFDLAAEFGRTVVVSGRSLMTNIELAREHGFLRVPPALHMDAAGLPPVADRDMVLLVTGSQGEPLSALSRITMGEHKHLTIHEGDTVVMSSRIIPGNARAITRLINQIYRLGAEVYYDKFRAIHASGHAHRDELRAMIETMRPQCFVPVHGEYRHLVKHARLAQECGVAPERAFILENGAPLTLLPQGVRLGERIHVESILVDGKGVGDVGHSVLKERHILGGEGMVIVVLVVDEVTWDVLHGPEMLSKGFVFEQHYNHVLEDAKCIVLDIFENIPPGETERLQDTYAPHCVVSSARCSSGTPSWCPSSQPSSGACAPRRFTCASSESAIAAASSSPPFRTTAWCASTGNWGTKPPSR